MDQTDMGKSAWATRSAVIILGIIALNVLKLRRRVRKDDGHNGNKAPTKRDTVCGMCAHFRATFLQTLGLTGLLPLKFKTFDFPQEQEIVTLVTHLCVPMCTFKKIINLELLNLLS